MPTISKQSIETIKAQLNLVDLVSPYVQLKQSGRSWTGLSPFTQEKTPSFYVHPDKGFFKCFSTGEGGDCYSFIMKVENLEFYEAVEFLSQKYSIPIQYEKGQHSAKELSIRKQILEIHSMASEWFHKQFMESEEAEAVRNYWQQQRKFSLDIAKEHRIGYAPVHTHALAQVLDKKNFSLEAMKASGLFFSSDRDQQIARLRSRFRGRLMIPIRDINARVIAFTARQLAETPEDDPSHKAKYVNSPETLIFHKSKLLFGMDHARKHLDQLPYFILVEGQLDAIRCWSVGLHTAIAPQGTAITEEQLILLRRYQTPKIECLLDGDAAGRKAALRTLPLCFKVGTEFSYLSLPEKTDPDDLLREGGAEALETLRANAFGPIQLLLDELLPNGGASSTQEKIKAAQKIFELLVELNSEIAQEDYLQTVSRIAQISLNSLTKDFAAYKKQRAKQNAFKSQYQSRENKSDRAPNRAPNQAPNQAPDLAPEKIEDLPLTHTNWELLYLTLNFPQYGKQIAYIIDAELIDSENSAGRFLKKVLAYFHENNQTSSIDTESLIENNQERQLLADIHTRELDVEDPVSLINACLRTLKKTSLNKKKLALTQKIQKTDHNDAKLIELMQKIKQINQELIDTQNLAIQ